MTDKSFWDFSFHEMGVYDVKANVDYVLKTTGFEKLVYFGHSQGTTQWFIANSLDPNITKHFRAFVGLAPVAHVLH